MNSGYRAAFTLAVALTAAACSDATRTTSPTERAALTPTGPASMSITPGPCAPGQYYDGSVCTDAPPGSYSPGGTVTTPTPCDAGYYNPLAAQTTCIPALAGSYVSGTGATSAVQCPPGTFTAGTASTSCTIVAAGSYATGPGATTATACAPGSFSSAPGAASCTLAPVGSYVPNSGATSAFACAAGFTTLVQGSTACLAATAQALTTWLSGQVQSLVTGGSLSGADGSTLTGKLAAAAQAYQRGNDGSGDHQMNAFINQVQGMQKTGRLSASAAAALIAAAQQVIAIG